MELEIVNKNIIGGIFAVVELNNSIGKNMVKIVNNENQVKINLNKVKIDSNEFEKKFDIFSNSKIVALEILTPDIMEELINFYENNKIDIEILIKDNYLYIRFDTGPMFEPNIFKKSNDIQTLWIYYNILHFVINFTTDLNKTFKDLII